MPTYTVETVNLHKVYISVSEHQCYTTRIPRDETAR